MTLWNVHTKPKSCCDVQQKINIQVNNAMRSGASKLFASIGGGLKTLLSVINKQSIFVIYLKEKQQEKKGIHSFALLFLMIFKIKMLPQ